MSSEPLTPAAEIERLQKIIRASHNITCNHPTGVVGGGNGCSCGRVPAVMLISLRNENSKLTKAVNKALVQLDDVVTLDDESRQALEQVISVLIAAIQC